MKKIIIQSIKAAVVGSAANKLVRLVLPKFVPAGVAALIALKVASSVFDKDEAAQDLKQSPLPKPQAGKGQAGKSKAKKAKKS